MRADYSKSILTADQLNCGRETLRQRERGGEVMNESDAHCADSGLYLNSSQQHEHDSCSVNKHVCDSEEAESPHVGWTVIR